MSIELNREVDVRQLTAEVSTALGRPVALAARPFKDGEPGLLAVIDNDTGDHVDLSRGDLVKVNKAISDHVIPVPVVAKTAIEELNDALDDVQDFDQLKAAIKQFATKGASDVEKKRAHKPGRRRRG